MDRISCDEKAVSIHRRINQTAQPYPSHDSLKDLFEKCAARYADAVAVVHRDRRLTYRSLNGLANEVAARLLEAGVRTGDTVGVCVERSPELIGALLAVLKCGAAYLPVDVSWPDQRLRAVLRAAGCRLVLGDQATALAERLPDQRIVSVQGGEETSLQHSNPVTRVGPDDIAYINFTSGSTGRPKGVPIRHRSVARLVFGARYARMGDDSVVLHASPVSFDAATFEIWGPLLHGGTCVLYPASFIRLSELRRVLADQGVTLVFLTTALFNTVVDEAPDALSGVRTILTGGEAHSISHIGKALAHYGPDRLVSVYGPTECTTFATCYPVRQLPRPARHCPSDSPYRTRGCTWLPTSGCAPPVRSARCGSPARVSLPAISINSAIRATRSTCATLTAAARGSIGQVIGATSLRTATWCSKGGWTTRSKSTVSGWRSARSLTTSTRIRRSSRATSR